MKRLGALAVVVALTLPACSLGERSHHANRLVASVKRAVEARTAVGTMTFALSSRPIGGGEGPPIAGGGGLAGDLTPPPSGEIAVVVDFAGEAASLALSKPEGGVEPIIVLDGTRVYVRRGSTGGISSRRWVVLDLAEVKDIAPPDDIADRTGVLLLAFPGPLQIVELLAGSLTGSVAQISADQFTANLSREKADRELRLDDRAIEHRETTLNLVAIVDEVHPAAVALDSDGRPSRLDVRFRPRLRPDVEVEVRVVAELTYQDAAVEIPSRDDTLVLETEGQLLGEIVGLGQALESGGFGAVDQ